MFRSTVFGFWRICGFVATTASTILIAFAFRTAVAASAIFVAVAFRTVFVATAFAAILAGTRGLGVLVIVARACRSVKTNAKRGSGKRQGQ